MLPFLFPRLTPAPARGAALFAAVIRKAREPHWYVEGAVPDSLDGRFRMLATIAALVAVRLEQEGDSGAAASVAMTERFIETMESEHRELGLGDPTLGRTVRKLVGSLAGRVELWRSMVAEDADWAEATRQSVYHAKPPHGLGHAVDALRAFWAELQAADVRALKEGRLA